MEKRIAKIKTKIEKMNTQLKMKYSKINQLTCEKIGTGTLSIKTEFEIAPICPD